MISATEHFQSLYEHYGIDFEEMYYDLTKLLDRPLKRGANTAEQKVVINTWTPIFASSATASAKYFIILGFILVSGSSQNSTAFLSRLPDAIR